MELSTNLKQRILSAAILAPVILMIIYFGRLPFTLLLTVITIIMAFEWHNMTSSHASTQDKAQTQFWQSLGIVYITLPVTSLFALRSLESGFSIVLWMLIVVWATDIAAYFTGRALGGPKLAPTISPNKTWSGLGGGVLAAGLAGCIFTWIIAPAHLLPITLLSAVLAVVAQGGDLLESGLKRHFGIKDSGTLIPGHGGILDRIDGLITAAPVVAIIVLVNGGRLF